MAGCGGQKYRVDYVGCKDLYENAKDFYRAGETVTVYYRLRMIATDTDYAFFLDGERLNCSYEEGKGFAITFTMPERDVKLECQSRNIMAYAPDAEN
ncbi:MAG: hypothetical protein IJK89_03265 [Clostridia bacterium]|nr:hypothetical protein [Clostridia bacterium]